MLAKGQEGDIELDDFEHNDCSVYLQKPHTNDDTLRSAERPTSDSRHHVQPSRNAVMKAWQVSPRNQVSHLRVREQDFNSSFLMPYQIHRHVSGNSSNYRTFEDYSFRPSIGIGRTGQFSDTKPSQHGYGVLQVRDHSREIVSYIGKGKGRLLDLQQGIGIDDSKHKYQKSLQGAGPHPSVPLARFEGDAQFERRQYYRKKVERRQQAARHSCTAIRKDKCRVHGEWFRQTSTQHQKIGEFGLGRQTSPGFVDQMFELDESARPCGTVYDLSLIHI